MKKFFCLIIAILLVLASVAVLYPSLLFKVYDEQQANSLLENVTDDTETFWSSLGFANFPFYLGVSGVLEKTVPYVNGETEELPNLGEPLSEICKAENFWETLYYFIILSLISIPVYMIFRLIPFNTLFRASDEAFLLSRPLLRGITSCACSVVSVTVTWFLYHTLIYQHLYKAVVEWAGTVIMPEIALNVTNILIIVVAIVCVIYLLKVTVFRGSFLKSVLMAVVRSALFVLIFSVINTFIGCDTVRVIVLGVIVVILIGIIDMVIDPAQEKEK